MKIPICEPDVQGNELKYVTDCILSNWISSRGSYINGFEDKFSKFVNAKHGIAVANGTAALHMATLALDIGEGDEVIIPTLTMIASANPVILAGATPVFVDSEPYTWNINVEAIEAKITPKTKAIMPVHIYGHPVDMDPLLKLGKNIISMSSKTLPKLMAPSTKAKSLAAWAMLAATVSTQIK